MEQNKIENPIDDFDAVRLSRAKKRKERKIRKLNKKKKLNRKGKKIDKKIKSTNNNSDIDIKDNQKKLDQQKIKKTKSSSSKATIPKLKELNEIYNNNKNKENNQQVEELSPNQAQKFIEKSRINKQQISESDSESETGSQKSDIEDQIRSIDQNDGLMKIDYEQQEEDQSEEQSSSNSEIEEKSESFVEEDDEFESGLQFDSKEIINENSNRSLGKNKNSGVKLNEDRKGSAEFSDDDEEDKDIDEEEKDQEEDLKEQIKKTKDKDDDAIQEIDKNTQENEDEIKLIKKHTLQQQQEEDADPDNNELDDDDIIQIVNKNTLTGITPSRKSRKTFGRSFSVEEIQLTPALEQKTLSKLQPQTKSINKTKQQTNLKSEQKVIQTPKTHQTNTKQSEMKQNLMKTPQTVNSERAPWKTPGITTLEEITKQKEEELNKNELIEMKKVNEKQNIVKLAQKIDDYEKDRQKVEVNNELKPDTQKQEDKHITFPPFTTPGKEDPKTNKALISKEKEIS
ncbi:MAG: hypothetical protein EZS28_007478, partial [Streblomastix strix]